MKTNYLLIIFLLLSTFGFAQSYDISGVVKEMGSGLPIPGANIQIKNTTKGSTTDFDGKFTLKGVSSGSTVVFSYIGFENFEYKVTLNNSKISISLKEESKVLQEVVVVGYGTQKKATLTGAVGMVKGADLNKRAVASLSTALQGTIAGVTVLKRKV